MKKCLSLLLALLLLITSVVMVTPAAQAATKKEKTRAIGFVFDNSGTMYIGGEDASKAWCRATYAMEALATMMNESDQMMIYPMNPIQIGKEAKDGKLYTSENPLVVTKANASIIEQIYTPQIDKQDTHIEAICEARKGLIDAKEQEKWLIVMTDGTEFYRDGKSLGKSSVSELTAEFNESLQSVNVMYLGIGAKSMPSGGFKVDGPGQYVERQAKTSAEVLVRLTELGNIIFGRDELKKVSDKLSFDVSISKLILFVQGASVDDVKLNGATPASVNQLKYSTLGAANYPKAGIDDSLQGIMLTYENLNIGEYAINNSEKADDIAVYYEPNVDLQFEFTDEYGRKVDPNNLYEGNYKVKYGMVDGVTGELITQSELLGDPSYVGYVSHNQEKKTIQEPS